MNVERALVLVDNHDSRGSCGICCYLHGGHPVLFLTGGRSTPSAHGVARLFFGALLLVELVGLGHMCPITHPEIVDEVIAAFLRRR